MNAVHKGVAHKSISEAKHTLSPTTKLLIVGLSESAKALGTSTDVKLVQAHAEALNNLLDHCATGEESLRSFRRQITKMIGRGK